MGYTAHAVSKWSWPYRNLILRKGYLFVGQKHIIRERALQLGFPKKLSYLLLLPIFLPPRTDYFGAFCSCSMAPNPSRVLHAPIDVAIWLIFEVNL